MPFLGGASQTQVIAPRAVAGVTESDQARTAETLSTQRGTAETILGGGVALGALDLVDTVASSVFGAERESVNRAALRFIDSPGLNDFYADTRGAQEVGSAVAGIIGTELALGKLSKPIGKLLQGASKVPYVRRLVALDNQYDAAMATVRAVDFQLAKTATLGSQQYRALAMAPVGKFDSATGSLTFTNQLISRNSAVARARGFGVAKGVRDAAGREAIYAVALNQNGFLYEDDIGQNLAWMGLGLVGGAVLDAAYTSYRIRKAAGADLNRRAMAGALDPNGIEEGRLLWQNRSGAKDSDGPGSFLGGTISDKITALQVEATTLRESPVSGDGAATLLSSRNALATQKTDLAFKETQKLTTKGIGTDGRTRFSNTAPGYGNALKQGLYRDPGLLHGAEMVGGVPDGMTTTQIAESHAARVKEQIADVESKLLDPKVPQKEKKKLRLHRETLEFESGLQPMALIDGELMPISEAQAFEGFVEPQIAFDKQARIWEVKSEAAAGRITLDESLTVHLPSGKDLNTADHYDVLRAYRLGQRAIQTLKNSTDPITIPAKPNWFQLDMAEEILKASEGRANVVWPDGMTRESAQVESIAQKASAIKKQRTQDLRARKAANDKGSTYEGRLSRTRVRFNLPRLTAYERGVTGEMEHPIEAVLRGMDGYGIDEVRKMTLKEVKETVARQKRLGDFTQPSTYDRETIHGNSFNYMLDESGLPTKPIMIYKRNVNPEIDWNEEALLDRIATGKMVTVNKLVAKDSGVMTTALTKALLDSPDFALASRPQELLETMIQGSVTGASPQSFFGALGKSVVSSEWRDRDAPILLAATRLRDTVDRLSRAVMKDTVDKSFGDSLSVLANPRNAGSRVLLNQLHSFRAGWELEAKPVLVGDKATFRLSNTEGNKTRFERQFGRKMAEGQTLLSPTGVEVVLDSLGLQIQNGFDTASAALLKEKNALLRANGLREIGTKPFYTPPPNTKGKLIGFLMGPDGRPVPGFSVVEASQESFDKARRFVVEKAEKELGLGYVFRTRDEISDFADVWDRAQMDFINPGTTAVQPGKTSRGALTGPQLNTTAFEESLEYLRNGFLQHGNDLMRTLMKDQIQASKMRAHISRDVSRASANRYDVDKVRGIHDIYLENLLGTSKLDHDGSLLGPIANRIEGVIDKALVESVGVWRATDHFLRSRLPGVDTDESSKEFRELTDKLGEYMPFKSAMELAERKSAARTPLTVQKITGEMNRFTAATVLRMLEVAHPIMNMAGLVNAMPSVIRHLRRLPSESAEEWSERVGQSASMFNVNGESIGVIDMAKIGARGLKNAWSKARHADYDFMVKRGYLSQEVAEFQRQFGAIDTKGRWETFMYGDPNSSNKFNQKGLSGWTGILSDKSEDLSRSWGHMVGLELADVLKIEGLEARNTFAHDMANKMIANYNPANRPEIFQGALGAPLGLFQSFAFNYYQRLFRYAETKDYHSLAVQYGVQGSLFGVTSLTGWNELQSLFMEASKGETDVDAGIFSRFGNGAGDLIASGAISNLPKLFGLPGVDLYSRGDTNVRLPGAGGSSLPGVAVVEKIAAGISEGLGLFSKNNPEITGAQLAEIASNMSANRPMAGLIEQFGGQGFDTDRYGQVVSDTENWAEAVYRTIGLRSMRQSQEVQAFYADKDAQEYQSAAKETLRKASRTAMRSGDVEQLPKVFETYVNQGGDVRHFKRWIRENYEAATVPRTQRKLEDLMNNPAQWGRVMNLLDRGVGIAEDDALGETDGLLYSGNPDDELNQDTLSTGQYTNQLTLEEVEE